MDLSPVPPKCMSHTRMSGKHVLKQRYRTTLSCLGGQTDSLLHASCTGYTPDGPSLVCIPRRTRFPDDNACVSRWRDDLQGRRHNLEAQYCCGRQAERGWGICKRSDSGPVGHHHTGKAARPSAKEATKLADYRCGLRRAQHYWKQRRNSLLSTGQCPVCFSEESVLRLRYPQ